MVLSFKKHALPVPDDIKKEWVKDLSGQPQKMQELGKLSIEDIKTEFVNGMSSIMEKKNKLKQERQKDDLTKDNKDIEKDKENNKEKKKKGE